jgi:hypothetical protein
MTLTPSGDGLACYLTSDSYRIAKLPRICRVETRLAIWDYEKALIPIFLVRVNRDAVLTFEAWIDPVDQAGISALKALAERPRMTIHLVGTQIERTMRVENPHQSRANGVVRRLERWQDWDTTAVTQARRDIHRLYPTTRDLWFAALEHA